MHGVGPGLSDSHDASSCFSAATYALSSSLFGIRLRAFVYRTVVLGAPSCSVAFTVRVSV